MAALRLLLLAMVVLAGVEGKKKDEQKYSYLVDLVVDHSEKMCRMVGRDKSPSKKYKPKARCAFVVDQIEEFVSEVGTDVMSKVENSMADVVDAAAHNSNMNEMKKGLKQICAWALGQKKAPTERATQEKIRATLNQWLLNCVTLQKKNDASALQPETIMKLRQQGINIPMPEMVEDEYDEGEYEDESWGGHQH